jgi:hypothetical protein
MSPFDPAVAPSLRSGTHSKVSTAPDALGSVCECRILSPDVQTEGENDGARAIVNRDQIFPVINTRGRAIVPIRTDSLAAIPLGD